MSERKVKKEERDNPLPSKCLGIFNLSLETTEKDLHELFFRYGEIEDVSLVTDKVSKNSRGFGFVYFKNIDDAEIAKEKIQGTIVQGKQIRVDYSVTLRAHTPTPGVYKGNKIDETGRKALSKNPRFYKRNLHNRISERERSETRVISKHRPLDDEYNKHSSRYEYSERRPRDWTDYTPRHRSPFNNRSMFY